MQDTLEILAAYAKEYLTSATNYCQVEVKVRDRIIFDRIAAVAPVDAILPPVSCSDIISKQYGGRRACLKTSNCDSFAKMS